MRSWNGRVISINNVTFRIVLGQVRSILLLSQVRGLLRFLSNHSVLSPDGSLHSRDRNMAGLLELGKCHYRRTKKLVLGNLRWPRFGSRILHFPCFYFCHSWSYESISKVAPQPASQRYAFTNELLWHHPTGENCQQILERFVHYWWYHTAVCHGFYLVFTRNYWDDRSD